MYSIQKLMISNKGKVQFLKTKICCMFKVFWVFGVGYNKGNNDICTHFESL